MPHASMHSCAWANNKSSLSLSLINNKNGVSKNRVSEVDSRNHAIQNKLKIILVKMDSRLH